MRIRIMLLPALLLLALTCQGQLPARSVMLPGVTEAAMRQRLAQAPLQPLEGIWYYPAEETTMAIEQWHGGGTPQMAYRLILLSSPDLELLPGTVMGYVAASVVSGKYHLWIYSERSHLTLLSPLECVATLNDAATALTFEKPHYRLHVRFNIARFLPSLFGGGVSIYPSKEQEHLPLGFMKTFPANGNGHAFNEIRYL